VCVTSEKEREIEDEEKLCDKTFCGVGHGELFVAVPLYRNPVVFQSPGILALPRKRPHGQKIIIIIKREKEYGTTAAATTTTKERRQTLSAWSIFIKHLERHPT
jgi:hypothetical protein